MKNFVNLLVTCVVTVVSISQAYTTEALADQVTNLPGAEHLDISFNQFSGYLQIPGSANTYKYIHYWFVESTKSPTTDPIAFWTNGGPGCSGLIGFMTEQGPFRPAQDGNLRPNPYAWNQVANMVFIESPAGVGFSYAENTDDYTTGDSQTAIDNYNTIQAFMKRFPEYSANDLYITSESYGGHYIPTLAKQIVDENAAGTNPLLNFKGYAIGNPYINLYSGTPAMFDTMWGHQLVSKPAIDKYKKFCTADTYNTLACALSALEVASTLGTLNPYALDYPVCTAPSLTDAQSLFGRSQRVWLLNGMLRKHGLKTEDMASLGLPSIDTYEPCESDYTLRYLNRDDVKQAIHVDTSLHWDSCSYSLNYSMVDSDSSMVPIVQYLLDGGFGLKGLIYSGDDDSICATIGTQAWIWDLGINPQPGSKWVQQILDGQPVGYLTKFTPDTKFAFLTVHGAGHEVPTYKPAVALDLFTKFLDGTYTGN